MKRLLLLLAIAACGTDDMTAEPGPLLSVTQAVPPGAACPVGGTQITAGLDDDRSGTLDPGEIDTTQVFCTEPVVLHGDVVIENANDASQLAGINELDGSLTIDAAGFDGLDLSALVLVHGDITCRGLGTPSLSLPRLATVDGSLVMQSIWPDAPSLQTVGGGVVVLYAQPAGALLPAVRTIGGNLGLTPGARGTTIELASLTEMGGGITLTGRMQFSAPRLLHTAFLEGGSAGEGQQNELRGVSLASLTTIDAGIGFFGTQLSLLDLPALRIASGISLSDNRQLCNSVGETLALRTGAAARIRNNKDC